MTSVALSEEDIAAIDRATQVKVPRWVYPDGKHTLATWSTGNSVFPRILTITNGEP